MHTSFKRRDLSCKKLRYHFFRVQKEEKLGEGDSITILPKYKLIIFIEVKNCHSLYKLKEAAKQANKHKEALKLLLGGYLSEGWQAVTVAACPLIQIDDVEKLPCSSCQPYAMLAGRYHHNFIYPSSKAIG